MNGNPGWQSRFGGVAVAASVGPAGCAPDTVYRAPSFGFSKSYVERKTGAPLLLSNAAWWRGFHDPTLDRLVDMALRDVPGFAIARERVVGPRAAFRGGARPR